VAPALVSLARESLEAWRGYGEKLQASSDVAIDLDLSGIVEAAFTDEEASALGAGAMDAAAARAMEPALAAHVVAARCAEGEGQVDPRRVRRALEAALQNAGGEIVRGARVVTIEQQGDALYGRLADGAGFSTGAIIIATGARAPQGACVPEGALYPVKGEALALPRREGAPKRVVRSAGAYLCPKADGRIVIGATEAPHDWTVTADAARVAALKVRAVMVCPGLAGLAQLSAWAGLRPATRDGSPIVGRAPEGPQGLFHALGSYRNGVLLAPAIARLVAAAVLDGAPVNPSFSAARFGAALGKN
jgi:glycine oxidase